MPSHPSLSKDEKAFSFYDGDNEEVMAYVTYLSRKIHISPLEVLNLPHSQFLALIKHNVIMDLEQTEEGREYLKKAKRYMNPRKKADYSAIRSFAGYQAKEGDK